MTKELEQRRADAANDGDAYTATVDSLEPHIHPIDADAYHASAAISLKRIADVAELFAVSLLKNHRAKDLDMRSWAERHGFGDLWDGSHD